jgi:hypothetical protein
MEAVKEAKFSNVRSRDNEASYFTLGEEWMGITKNVLRQVSFKSI